jgi:hypothetical protein
MHSLRQTRDHYVVEELDRIDGINVIICRCYAGVIGTKS